MAELIQQYREVVRDGNGSRYFAQSWAQQREDGLWAGWIEFRPEEDSRPPRRTGIETTQPEREDIIYWASGIEPVYLEGAFARSREVG